MKIYLASRYSRFPEMQRVRADLEVIGHTVTSRWIDGTHQALDGCSTFEQDQGFAEDDCADLTAADCVISFTEPPRSEHTRGGRHVEFGLAIALGKRLIVIGHRENIFHSLPFVWFYPTWQECMDKYRAAVGRADHAEELM